MYDVYIYNVYTHMCVCECVILFTFREREKGGSKTGRETSMSGRNIDWLPLACPQMGTWPTTEANALTGDRTGDLLVHR